MHIRQIAALALMILSPAAAWATDAPLVGNASVGSGYPTRRFECLPNLAVGEGNVTLVQFDLSTLPTGVSGPAILKATLTIFVNQVGKPGTLDVAPVQSSWSEPTVTHSSLPGIGLPIGAGVSVELADEYYSFDVTAQVQDWVAAPARPAREFRRARAAYRSRRGVRPSRSDRHRRGCARVPLPVADPRDAASAAPRSARCFARRYRRNGETDRASQACDRSRW